MDTSQPYRETQYLNDPSGLVTQQTDPDGLLTTRFEYDTLGNVTLTTEISSVSTRLSTSVFDIFDEPVASIDWRGLETDYFYDPDGEVITTTVGAELVTAALHRVTMSTYDPWGEVTETVDPQPSPTIASRITESFFDAYGDLTGIIDGAELVTAQQRVTTMQYDPFGDLVATFDPMDRETAYLVDPDGEVTDTIDGANTTAPARRP